MNEKIIIVNNEETVVFDCAKFKRPSEAFKAGKTLMELACRLYEEGKRLSEQWDDFVTQKK